MLGVNAAVVLRPPYVLLRALCLGGAIASMFVLGVLVHTRGAASMTAVVSLLVAAYLGALLIRSHHYVLMATISIGLGVLQDWYQLLPWFLGIRVPVIAGSVALIVIS